MTDSIVPQDGGADNRPPDRDSPLTSGLLAAARAVISARHAAEAQETPVHYAQLLYDALLNLEQAVAAVDAAEQNRIAGMTMEQQLQLRGLLMMAQDLNADLRNLERAACRLTGEEIGSHTSDAIWEGYSFEDLIERLIAKERMCAALQEQGDGEERPG